MERTIFPENIKILSWNYDFQIQLAAEVFSRERFIQNNNTFSHELPMVGYYPTHGGDTHISDISLLHLNGIAGSYYSNQLSRYKSFFERDEERSWEHLLDLLTTEEFNANSLLTFAWESGINTKKRTEFSKDIAARTDVLIIIGYSFPFFNRKIDKEIFDAMKAGGRLKTIYYQDPIKSGEFLRNQFGLSEDIIIKDVKEVDNYFVPLEL